YFAGLLPTQYPPREESMPHVRNDRDAAERSEMPVVIVQHELPADSPIVDTGSATAASHPDVAAHEARAARRYGRRYASAVAGTGLADWVREQDVDTVTLVGYMTNNCVLASAADAEPLGFAVEVLSDATGAIDLANDVGRAPAQQVHQTLMALLHSNWAAVADTSAWPTALQAGDPLGKTDLVTSADRGRATA